VPIVYRRSTPPAQQPLPEGAILVPLDDPSVTENGALLNRERALVQLRRARLQIGLATPKGSTDVLN